MMRADFMDDGTLPVIFFMYTKEAREGNTGEVLSRRKDII